jgi:hypothetical protein
MAVKELIIIPRAGKPLAFRPGRRCGLQLTETENILRLGTTNLVANSKLKPAPECEALLRDTFPSHTSCPSLNAEIGYRFTSTGHRRTSVAMPIPTKKNRKTKPSIARS